MDDIEQHPEYAWRYNWISHNPNLTEKFIILICIRSLKDSLCKLLEDWNWYFISKNSNITFDIVQRHMNWSWNWSSLSKNPNITSDIIESNPHLPWNWSNISQNKNLTEEFIRKNIYQHNLTPLSNELFTNKLNLLEKDYQNLSNVLCK